jgi:hypothetical protein
MQSTGLNSGELAVATGEMKAQEAALQMSVSVLKQRVDAEQQQAQALIKMMNQSPTSPDGRGAFVDAFI